MMKLLFLLTCLFGTQIHADECSNCQKAGRIDIFINALEKISDPTLQMTKIEGMSICRINPDRNPFDGGWGHWWVELTEDESYGWWAIENFGKDIDFEKLKKVFSGVPGELNGQTLYGGSLTQDPMHGDRREDATIYDVYITKNRSPSEVQDAIRNFAQNYKSNWSWPAGTNCHSFQNEIIKKFGLIIKRREE